MHEQRLQMCRRVSRLVKMLAHPTRLEIICVLKDGETCVKDICRALDKRQANISQHLGLLRQGGFIDLKREGNTSRYFIANEKVVKVLQMLREE
jgi:ArsR family transcriptional regulator